MPGSSKGFKLIETGDNRITEKSLIRRGSYSEQAKQLDNMLAENRRLVLEQAVEQSFKDQFISHLQKQGILISSPDQISSLNRHASLKDARKTGEHLIGRKRGIHFAIAFAVARGKAVIEKSRKVPHYDTTRDFQKRYSDPEVGELDEKGYCEVRIKVKGNEKASYTHRINPSEGIIQVIGEGISKEHDDKIVLEGTKALPYSEILWHAYKAVILKAGLSGENFNCPTEVLHRNVTNEETAQTSSLFQKESTSPFEKGSDGYYAMLGTPNCYGMLYFLEQHTNDLGNKEITKIELKGGYLGHIRIHIGDKT